jgi:protein O-mannosyl-transferase
MKSRRLAIVLVVAGLIAYANSLGNPFLFDDYGAIVENATIRSFSTVMSPPREQPTAGRPLVNASFALNYAVHELDVTGYHAVNLSIHLICGLLLYGIMRRTLQLPRFRDVFGGQSAPLSFVVALLWVLHPLNSEVVDYTSQRTESLMAVFYLLTFYAAIRAEPGERKWRTVAVVSCALGMACKESMVTAPVAVLVYDLAFRFPSAAAAYRHRRGFYGALMCGWLVLGALMWDAPRSETAGFSTSVSLPAYLLNQAVLVTHYLRLALWPSGLVLNYGRPVSLTLAEVVPELLIIAAMIALTAYAWAKRHAIAFVGLFFFLTLAPTSLVPIATEVGAERRMYLPLMALVAAAVLGTFAFLRRFRAATPRAASASPVVGAVGVVTVVVVAAAMGSAVAARNAEYQSPLVMARTVVERWPSNVGEAMAGIAAGEAGLNEEALTHLQAAVDQGNIDANFPLAVELSQAGRDEESIQRLQALLNGKSNIGVALEIAARRALADAYFSQQDAARAIGEYELYLAKRPNDAEALDRLGRAQASLGRHADAAATFERLVGVKRDNPEAWRNLVTSLLLASRLTDAEQRARQALVLNPTSAPMLDLLGRVLLASNRVAEAVEEFEKAVRSDPSYAPAQQSLAALRSRL